MPRGTDSQFNNRFSLSSDHLMLSNIKKKARGMLCDLLVSVSPLNVYIQDNTIRKSLNKSGFRGRVAMEKKKNFSPKCIWSMTGLHAWHKPNTAYHYKIPHYYSSMVMTG